MASSMLRKRSTGDPLRMPDTVTPTTDLADFVGEQAVPHVIVQRRREEAVSFEMMARDDL